LLAATGTSTGGSSLFLVNDIYGDPVIEFNSNGSIAAANTFGRDGLVGRYAANQSVPQAFYAYDMQGDTVQQFLSNGTVDNWIRYLSAGQGRVSTLNTYGANIETYSNYGAQWGYRNDPGTSMEITGHRFYDFNDARFFTRDPAGYAGGIDLYQYAGGNPVNYSDPGGPARRTGKTPPNSWPEPPPTVVGKKPKWDPDGFWGKGRGGNNLVWDPTGHGGGGHWDEDQLPGNKHGGGRRWDKDGNILPCWKPGQDDKPICPDGLDLQLELGIILGWCMPDIPVPAPVPKPLPYPLPVPVPG
jgi:RHS repeat-associated protein